jgi:hypothetical protein
MRNLTTQWLKFNHQVVNFLVFYEEFDISDKKLLI